MTEHPCGPPPIALDITSHLLAGLTSTEPVPLPSVQDVRDALARFEADRPRLVVPPADRDRVQAALDKAPLDSPVSMVTLVTSDLVPDGQAYVINTQAINEAIEQHLSWPTNAAVRWSE